MAPLPLPSSHSSESPQTNFPFSFLLSSSFPFPPQNLISKPSFPDRTVQNAHQFLKDLSSAFSNHPFVKPIFSFHAEFRNFCQMNRKEMIKPTNLSAHGFGAVTGDSAAGLVVANGISNFLNLYNALLVTRIILTWFPNAPPVILNPLSQICDPYLNVFRGLIPPLGGIDLSPILAFLVLDAFTSTAAALPAELPNTEVINTSNLRKHGNVKRSEELWMRRILFSKKSKNDGKVSE